MLTFFILLFALANIDKSLLQKLNPAHKIIEADENKGTPPFILLHQSAIPAAGHESKTAQPPEYVYNLLKLHLQSLVDSKLIELSLHKKQTILLAQQEQLFLGKLSVFNQHIEHDLREVALACGRFGNQLAIEVDTEPTRDSIVRGLMRGKAVVQIFKKMGYNFSIPVYIEEKQGLTHPQIRLLILPQRARASEDIVKK